MQLARRGRYLLLLSIILNVYPLSRHTLLVLLFYCVSALYNVLMNSVKLKVLRFLRRNVNILQGVCIIWIPQKV
jgi:hypothetical protein